MTQQSKLASATCLQAQKLRSKPIKMATKKTTQTGQLEKMLAETIAQQVFNHSDVINGKVYIQNYMGLIDKLTELLEKYQREVLGEEVLPRRIIASSALEGIEFI